MTQETVSLHSKNNKRIIVRLTLFKHPHSVSSLPLLAVLRGHEYNGRENGNIVLSSGPRRSAHGNTHTERPLGSWEGKQTQSGRQTESASMYRVISSFVTIIIYLETFIKCHVTVCETYSEAVTI